MNSHFYTTTLMKATVASLCDTGYFISPTQFNLIVAKCNWIEIYLINEHRLVLLSETELYGKIEIMKVFRPKTKNTDLIFVVTADYNAMILEFIQASDKIQIITKGYCNVFDNYGGPTGFMATIEPNAKIVLLKLFDRLFKVISLEAEGELKVFSFTFEETNIQDLCFLYGCTDPTFIIIHKNSMDQFITVKEINTCSIECIMNIQNHFFTEKETSMVIPVPKPIGGAIIVGEKSILYYNGCSDIRHSLVLLQRIHIVCYTRLELEGTRYLLGDQSGLLFMLFLKCEKISEQKFTIQDMELQLLFGEISIPNSLTYLDNQVIFVASKYGNSQLIKLNCDLNGMGNSISILDEHLNIGPIVDMCSVSIDRHAEQIVTCSGAYKDGTLRIISKEVEIRQKATIDLSGVKGIWALSYNTKSDLDDTLVLSFIWYSKVLIYTNKEFEETNVEGFESELQTFYCGKIFDNKMVQITSASVRLICMKSKKLINEWIVPDSKNINAVSCNGQIAVCSSGNDLYYIEIGSETIFQNRHIKLKHEVSCLDICLFKDMFDETIVMLAVGLWIDASIKIFKLPDFVELIREPLLEGIVPRSISFVTLENMQYLFCALGNGNLCYFDLNVETLETDILCNKKMIKLDNLPALIKKFQTTSNIFICSDKPIIIHSSNKKLVFTKVNSIKINNLCVMNMVDDPNSLIVATDTSIIIGVVNMNKKLHVRSIYLYESPRRIAYQDTSKTFGITTIKKYKKKNIRDGCLLPSASISIPNTSGVDCLTDKQPINELLMSRSEKTSFNYNPEFELSNMIILHQDTFEILHVYRLELNEYALSIISTKLGNDPKTYYVLGTAFMSEDCQTPEDGRIIVFHYDSSISKLTLITAIKILGGCFSMIQNQYGLMASVNSSIKLFKWCNDRDRQYFVINGNQNTRSISRHLRFNGNVTICDDLIRELTHYKYKIDELEKIIPDYLKSTFAIENFKDGLFVGAENGNNLYVFERSRALGCNNVRYNNYQVVGRLHMYDLINIFRHSIQTNMFNDKTILYGTVSGALGFIRKTNPKFSGFLADFQKSLSIVIKEVEMMPHHFKTEFTKFNTGFLDENLIKKFLELSISNKESVIEGLRDSYSCEFQRIFKQTEVDIEDVTNLIEDLLLS